MHHSFFACWSVRQQYCFSYREPWQKKKVVNFLLSTIRKTNSSYWKQMEQDLSTHRCRAKSAKNHDVTSSDSIRDEYPCKRKETAISPTQPASTETYQEKAQETYPWIKEVRSKGTKPNSIFFCISVVKTYTGQLEGVGRLQSLLFLCTFLTQRYFQNQKTNF